MSKSNNPKHLDISLIDETEIIITDREGRHINIDLLDMSRIYQAYVEFCYREDLESMVETEVNNGKLPKELAGNERFLTALLEAYLERRECADLKNIQSAFRKALSDTLPLSKKKGA